MKRPPIERLELGRTGLKVSRLAFGTGYLADRVRAGARLLTEAYDAGVNFWDTSDDYGTHAHLRRALKETGRDNVEGVTKPYAATALAASRSVTTPLTEPG